MVGRRGPQRLQSGTSDMADLAGKGNLVIATNTKTN